MAHPASRRKNSSSSLERQNSKKNECGTCLTTVAKKDKALQCELCEIRYHTSCEKIDEETYELIMKDSMKDVPLIHWYCSKQCNKVASKYLGGVMHLEREVQKLSEKVSQVDKTLADLSEGKLPEKMVQKVKEISQQCSKSPADVQEQKTLMKDIITEREKEQRAEMEERARRKNNLMVFGIPESTKNKDERAKEDKTVIKQLLEEIKVDQNPFEYRRIGKPQDNDSSKSRPVRITFQSEKIRDDALKAYHRIRK